MPFPIEAQIAAPFIVFVGYTVFGITGFGASITTIPLLAHFFPLRFAVPLMLLNDLAAGLLVGYRNRGVLDRREIARIVPFLLIGVVLGLTVLVQAPQRVLVTGLGAFVLCYSAYSVLLRPSRAPIRAAWVAPIATAGGVFSALFGTGGPVYAIYLARRLPDPSAVRATASAVISVSGITRLVLFSLAGLYAQEGILWLGLLCAPAMLAGLALGSRLHRRIDPRAVVRIIWGLLAAGGASLIVRGLTS